jgi:hypothetical protein
MLNRGGLLCTKELLVRYDHSTRANLPADWCIRDCLTQIIFLTRGDLVLHSIEWRQFQVFYSRSIAWRKWIDTTVVLVQSDPHVDVVFQYRHVQALRRIHACDPFPLHRVGFECARGEGGGCANTGFQCGFGHPCYSSPDQHCTTEDHCKDNDYFPADLFFHTFLVRFWNSLR